ncbi:MAG: hypothetical protein NXY59_10160 [Aigarchaeota archaeon]|nr:hypothetical protein [Candidatus Pelearchaeum maunauluense]
MTRYLKAVTGLPLNYEGYAYLPHVMFIFLPFYMFYLTLGGSPLPIMGVHDPAHPFKVFFHPDVFTFLFFIKIPILIADVFIALTLYKHFDKRAAWFYVLAPYSVFVSSVWGMFDSMVALFLLTALLLKKQRFPWAGLVYGLSLMKFYTIYAGIPILYGVWKQRGFKALASFIVGVALSQLPTLYFFVLNLRAFLGAALLFHSESFGGGVNR